jgi:hypothetical protein
MLSPLRFASLTLLAAVLGACSSGSPAPSSRTQANDLTGISGVERGIRFQGQVIVPTTAATSDISEAIAREVQTALGALQQPEVSLENRGATNALTPSTWTEQTLAVVDPTNPGAAATSVLRVTYQYNDEAVVTDTLDRESAIAFVMLADDYSQHAAPLEADCSSDPTDDPASLWYDFAPQNQACQTDIQTEITAITQEESALAGRMLTIGPKEAGRWFLPVTATLDPPVIPTVDYSPEYDRLYGVGTGKSQLVVYMFNGVDSDETNPDDILGQEAIRFLRTMLNGQPNFRPVNTNPFAMLEDISVNGTALTNVTYAQMFSWILDQNTYPPEVGTDATAIAALRAQAIAKFTERWIYWDLPLTVKNASGTTSTITVEVRFFYGDEASTPTAQQNAEWRYLEAFWYGDVFLYNGHSHFGNGPLDPQHYGPQNFNANYQLMLVNSCLSYNYYHEDFFTYKPGGTQNLDMIINGLPSYVWGGGEATGNLLVGLLDGKQETYKQLLKLMEIDTPWGQNDYEPMRVADGELDNVFSQAKTPLSVAVLPPVYP